MHPKTKMGAALTKKQRIEWNNSIHALKWVYFDRVYDIISHSSREKVSVELMIEDIKIVHHIIHSLPIFDTDGKGSSWSGEHIFLSYKKDD